VTLPILFATRRSLWCFCRATLLTTRQEQPKQQEPQRPGQPFAQQPQAKLPKVHKDRKRPRPNIRHAKSRDISHHPRRHNDRAESALAAESLRSNFMPTLALDDDSDRPAERMRSRNAEFNVGKSARLLLMLFQK